MYGLWRRMSMRAATPGLPLLTLTIEPNTPGIDEHHDFPPCPATSQATHGLAQLSTSATTYTATPEGESIMHEDVFGHINSRQPVLKEHNLLRVYSNMVPCMTGYITTSLS
ncbi:uncharacterized protein BT62DRAFT_1013679 [Guyanagaster necrorhizus]|uniref:Uncharacterized protein n=1 Tax=Guyanagaster necrorhizus TaxID=856835 RepID=A0A9P8AKX3_9AGAR|nr:uncharacterized protein BT62DRAFT_1013679 [Guyanagaster necrorhizus MCA 3950]KAG7439638.1 hypothetical protein BT62DRAFT_1013679 [Guyanagaster necrorhizus MCA 3950]